MADFLSELGGVSKDDAVHANGDCTLYVDRLVVCKQTFFGNQIVAVEQALVYGWFWLYEMFFGRNYSSVEKRKDRVLLHGQVYFAAPVSKAIELVALLLERREELIHAGHFANDNLWIMFDKHAYFWFIFGVKGNEVIYDLVQRLGLAVEGVERI